MTDANWDDLTLMLAFDESAEKAFGAGRSSNKRGNS